VKRKREEARQKGATSAWVSLVGGAAEASPGMGSPPTISEAQSSWSPLEPPTVGRYSPAGICGVPQH
jgi:hypothetical protein